MKIRGFTLIELLITLAIIGIVAVMSFVKISYRMKVSKLEEAAQSLTSDLDYARSAAMMKSCPVRIVFCQDRNCSSLSDEVISVGGGSAIGSGDSPSKYYGFLRMSQKITGDDMCFFEDAIEAARDGFDRWDMDRRPQMISSSVVFSPIYDTSDALPDVSDWSDTTSAEASNSLWFSDEGRLTLPVVDTANVIGTSVDYFIAFQVRLDDCNPNADDDCLGFLIAAPQAGGQSKLVRCATNAGARSGETDSNDCF